MLIFFKVVGNYSLLHKLSTKSPAVLCGNSRVENYCYKNSCVNCLCSIVGARFRISYPSKSAGNITAFSAQP